MKGLMEGWSRQFPSDSLAVFGPADLTDNAPGVESLAPRIKLPPKGILQSQLELPLRHRRAIESSTAVISGHVARPLLPVSKPIIGTIHDVRHLRQPQDFHPLVNLYRRRMWSTGASRLAGAVAVSRFSLDEATELGMPLPEFVAVAKLGSDHVQRRTGVAKQNFVLCVAHRGSKLDPGLATIWKQVEDQTQASTPRLVVSGVSDQRLRSQIGEQFRRAGVVGRPDFLDYMPQSDFEDLIESARAVLYLSNYEGFGLVPSEATALGTMSFTYDLPPYRERIDELCITMAPLGEPRELGEHLARYINSTSDPAPTPAVVQTSWGETAQVYRDLVLRISANGPR